MSQGVQACVRSVIHEGRACILKAPRLGLLKSVGVWTLRREDSIYRKLEGVEGIPKCFGLTADGLLLEAIVGRPLSEYRKGHISVPFLDRLDRIITAVHERGVAHSDLKKRANILVVEHVEQAPVVVDFGAAFMDDEPFYETFRRVDLAAAAKLRAHHQPQTLRAEQKTILEHPTWAERLSRLLIRGVRDPYRALFSHKG